MYIPPKFIQMKKTAIVLGASGITGSILLQKLLNDSDFEKIKLFSRKPTGFTNSKIEEHIVDLLHLENYKSVFTADVVFCCIGTTKAITPDQTEYRAIDYGIPVTAAILSKENNIPTFIVISALGVSPTSNIFYNRTKGEMEREVLAQKIDNTYILQPSLIDYARKGRIAEQIGVYVMRVLNSFLIGSLQKYRSISPVHIAETMLQLTKKNFPLQRIESDKIKLIATHQL